RRSDFLKVVVSISDDSLLILRSWFVWLKGKLCLCVKSSLMF
ncbi:unnamed protein product, partial [Arabidopsis halleri]